MPYIYLAITLVFALMVLFSGIGKIRRDPRQVKIVSRHHRCAVGIFPGVGWVRVCWGTWTHRGHLVAPNRDHGGNGPGPLFLGSRRSPSARWGCQGNRSCCVYAGARGRSAGGSSSYDVNPITRVQQAAEGGEEIVEVNNVGAIRRTIVSISVVCGCTVQQSSRSWSDTL